MGDRSAGYTPLNESINSPSSPNNLSPPFPSEYTNGTESSSSWRRVRRWWAHNVKLPWLGGAQETAPPPQSGYLTLIPLSDSRLQPRSTRFTALFLLAFALAVAGSVFLVVPRSVSVGELSIHADRMSWNMSKSTYQLKLLVQLPVYNPNYFKASIEGNLNVLFYGTEAGKAVLEPVSLQPRAAPKFIDVKVDASDVPGDYILSILTQCSTFPEVLIFFLKGKLSARYMWQRQHLPTIDTYFMIPCSTSPRHSPKHSPPLEAAGRGMPGAPLTLPAPGDAEEQWQGEEEEQQGVGPRPVGQQVRQGVASVQQGEAASGQWLLERSQQPQEVEQQRHL